MQNNIIMIKIMKKNNMRSACLLFWLGCGPEGEGSEEGEGWRGVGGERSGLRGVGRPRGVGRGRGMGREG